MNHIALTELKQWFLEEQRDLPWRKPLSDPYFIWVSEVMLQQTQVSVVIPYFERWIERFPSIEALARATLPDVLKLWEGLGYYSRARNLHEGARYVLKHHQGQLPSTCQELAKIKGLGPYTIGAILSFAFRKKAPAVDGNVVRVLARYFMLDDDISQARTLKILRDMVQEFLPDEEHWLINEGLIELGAKVCGRKPQCEKCPLKRSCKSFAHGSTHIYPIKSARTKVTLLYRSVAVIRSQNSFLVSKGKGGEVMADLYQFPYFETEGEGWSANRLADEVLTHLGLPTVYSANLEMVSHSFTRYRAHLYPILLDTPIQNKVDAYEWHSLIDLKKLPFSSGHRRVLLQLDS